MNFLRAYLNVFLALILLALIGAAAVIAVHVAIYFHIIGQHDYVAAAAIGYLLGIIIAILLSPLIWWYLDKYL